MPRTRQHAPPIAHDPWTPTERMVGAYVAGYVVLSVVLWGGVWHVIPHRVIPWWVIGFAGAEKAQIVIASLPST